MQLNTATTQGICFMIQARMGSSRLPQKMNLPFYEEETLLTLLLQKLQSHFDLPIVLATSEHPSNSVLETVALAHGVQVFRGAESDVLGRFVSAAETFQYTRVIRICADNPFLDVASLHTLLATVAEHPDVDYMGFRVNGLPAIKTHFGFWAEYVSVAALQQVQAATSDAWYHEHVTNYLYEHPETFALHFIPVPSFLEGRTDIRMTLDTPEDFTTLSAVFADLVAQYGFSFGLPELVTYLESHPDYLGVMETQIRAQTK